MTFDSVPRYTFSWMSSESVWKSVVDAVASASRVDPLDLPPLADVIEPAAVDTLLQRSVSDGSRGRRIVLCFSFAGYRVLLSSAGHGYLYGAN